MRSFYHSLGFAVLACICFGALFARRLAGDDSIGTYDLTMTFVFMAFSIYMTIDAYKLDKEIRRSE
jgi:hypothetical protein